MNKILTGLLTLLLLTTLSLSVVAQNENAAAQNENTNTSNSSNANESTKKKRGPIFRANKEQIKQAQALLKQRGFYSGEETGKLDPDTRAGLKLFQAAEKIKVTGTLNKITLEKMNITLTEKQKAM